MARKRTKAPRELRGVQKWIVTVLRDAGPSVRLSTAKLAKRIAKSSGKRYHPNSVYNGLRLLTSQGAIRATRKGNEKSYAIAEWSQAPIARSEVETKAPTRADLPDTAVDSEHALSPESIRLAAGLPHKLALGEILVFPVRDGQVLAATNLHGRLVFEQHVLPA